MEDSNQSGEAEREFQSVIQKFLDAAVKSRKRKLIIDVVGNTGGWVDSGTDLFAQLFPYITPNSRSDMRVHEGLDILANAASAMVATAEETAGEDDEDIQEHNWAPLAYQTVVDSKARAFPDLTSFLGPFERNGGNFTGFFQNDYTDPNSSDFQGTGIVVTGTNNRTGFRQPFAPQDIIVMSEGMCSGTCAVVLEMLKDYAGVQSVSIGGRPQTGPMQTVGGVKGAHIFPFAKMVPDWTGLLHDTWQGGVDGTIWENFTSLPYLRSPSASINGRNHYRMDDATNTPLQFVYEASDCRIWWTREMLHDPTFLWKRVATVAFKERRGTQFNSKYCVKDSTGHPTSLSGGWKSGTLGPQEPPKNA
jgi:hypothetical protein